MAPLGFVCSPTSCDYFGHFIFALASTGMQVLEYLCSVQTVSKIVSGKQHMFSTSDNRTVPETGLKPRKLLLGHLQRWKNH